MSRTLDNLKRIRKSIGDGVVLVVVTKGRGVSEINEVIAFGVGDVGENRIGEALEKFPGLEGVSDEHDSSEFDVKKHFIGVIQSNKIRKIVENFDLIQSVDRLKVARLVDECAGDAGKIMPVLVQVNISREDNKSGVLPEGVIGFIEEVSCLENIRVVGLMCIGSSGNKSEFREMKGLFDELAMRGFCMGILSMGMSADFEMAIEEGSNMVRVGRGIFA